MFLMLYICNTSLNTIFFLYFQIFYVIRSFLAGLLPGKEVIVDAWPEWTSIVVRTSSQEEVGHLSELYENKRFPVVPDTVTIWPKL